MIKVAGSIQYDPTGGIRNYPTQIRYEQTRVLGMIQPVSSMSQQRYTNDISGYTVLLY